MQLFYGIILAIDSYGAVVSLLLFFADHAADHSVEGIMPHRNYPPLN